MAEIIVTTPKQCIAVAAEEAEDAKRAGGDTRYFRRFPLHCAAPNARPGDRVFYVEDGYIRGFCVVDEVSRNDDGQRCDTTGQWYGPGLYLWMRADSWKWIDPIKMRGFQSFRYINAEGARTENIIGDDGRAHWIRICGGWLDPRPSDPARLSGDLFNPRDAAILGGDPSL